MKIGLKKISHILWLLFFLSYGSLVSAAQQANTSARYVCPMHPQVVRDHEGVCPICGMDLVLQTAEQSQPSSALAVDAVNATQAIGFGTRTVAVQKTTLWQYIKTFGRVQQDETKVMHVHPLAAGWISDLGVRNNGDYIEKGQLLYRLYSPEIVSAQQDYLLALQNAARLSGSTAAQKTAQSIVSSAKTRLSLLGVDSATQALIAKQNLPIHHIPIYAPQSGFAENLAVQNGMYVQPKTELMSLNNLNDLWVIAEVLPLQQAWLKSGLTVDLQTDAMPNAQWESHIDYIYPTLDKVTQATQVRIPFDNRGGELRPNQLMQVVIYGGPKHDVLAIPQSAVVDDGREQRVVKQIAPGQYQVAQIKTGMQTAGMVEIVSGLDAGDQIVVSGQFLLDSESQIQQNLARLNSANGKSDMTFSPVPNTAEHSHVH